MIHTENGNGYMMDKDEISRHKLVDRVFHWLMALCMLVLLGTGLLPVLGLDFSWVLPHWIAGLLFSTLTLFHVVRSLLWKNLKSLWIESAEIKAVLPMQSVSPNKIEKPGKYTLEQKLMHHSVSIFSLVAIVTGFFMLVKIDMPFWERDPYWLSAASWGTVYLLHGFAALFFLSLIMLHVYFSLRPEKRMYLRSMVRGWIKRSEYIQNHDSTKWPEDQKQIDQAESPKNKD